MILVSTFGFCSIAAVAAAPQPQEFRITDVQGQVAIMPKGKSTASPAVKGFPLQAGDRLITGDKGRVELAAKEGTVLHLKEKSYCRVQSLEPGRSSFFVKFGRLLGRFAPSKDTGISYRVGTPVIVASVRGTELGVSVEDNGKTEGGVVEGVVDFKKPAYGPNATIDWSDEDPRWDEPETAPAPSPIAAVETSSAAAQQQPQEVTVSASEGVSAEPGAWPKKMSAVPPVIVADLTWFTSVRERVPALREQWKDLDAPSKMRLRQQALRDRISWQIPAKLQPKNAAPEKISIPKKQLPKPR
jgi:hypothetical protein